MRAPAWAIVLLLLVIVGLGVYAYFTTPLPFGLSALIRTPGGANVAPAASPSIAPGSRTAAGQPLVLGATNLTVQAAQRNQPLALGGGTAGGSFTILQIELQNAGNEPLSPRREDFRLVDERARSYVVDLEATRAVNQTNRRRVAFDASVPPGGRLVTLLAFETPPDVGGLTLRVNLGYGDLELPR